MNGVVCDTVVFSVRRNGPCVFVSEMWFVNFPYPNKAIATRKCNLDTRQMTLPMWRNSSNGNFTINDGCMTTYVCVVMWAVRVLDCVVAKQYGEVTEQHVNLLTPNVNCSGRTAPLTSKVAFYIFIQQI